MPKRIPRLDLRLSAEAQSALEIVRSGEVSHRSGEPSVRQQWTISKLESLHELAYLRVFLAWEKFLEDVFYRSMCGYASRAGSETLVTPGYFASLASAEIAILTALDRDYVLWHNPDGVIARCNRFISNAPGCPCRQATVISSNKSHLENLGAVRHRIVHNQTDAKRKFDRATRLIAGRTYSGSSPGRFLRDWNTTISPSRKWLDIFVSQLVGMASQIV